jgi:hypothetical protein
MFAPQLRHRFGVDQFENTFFAVQPLDEPRAIVGVLQQFQQELPQVSRGTYAYVGGQYVRNDMNTR